jgi:predicted MFS family arabinose efflux permease
MIDNNFTRSEGSIVISVTGVAAVLGRALASLIVFKCKKWPMMNHFIYLCLILAAAHTLVLRFIDSFKLLMLACVLRGAAFSMFNALTPTVVYEASGYEKYPAAMAFANVSIGLGDFLSCVLGGKL